MIWTEACLNFYTVKRSEPCLLYTSSPERIEELMMETGVLTKDVGSILVGERAVREGLIDEIGGISKALAKLHAMVDKGK